MHGLNNLTAECPIQQRHNMKRNFQNSLYFNIRKTSGVVRLFEVRGERSQWLLLTKVMTFKRLQSFVEMPFTWLSNFKFAERSHNCLTASLVYCVPDVSSTVQGKLVLFASMQYSLRQRIFIVETCIRKKQYEKCRRKFRTQFPGVLVPSKSSKCESWRR